MCSSHIYPLALYRLQYFLFHTPSYSNWKGFFSSLSGLNGLLGCVGRSVTLISPKFPRPDVFTRRRDWCLPERSREKNPSRRQEECTLVIGDPSLAQKWVPFLSRVSAGSEFLSQLQTNLCDSRPLLSKALYSTFVRCAVWDDFISELDVTKEEDRLLWLCALGVRCLNNDKASFTLADYSERSLGQQGFVSAQLAILLECIRCNNFEELIEHAFFHCLVVQPQCKLVEGNLVRIQNGKFLSWKPVLCAAI